MNFKRTVLSPAPGLPSAIGYYVSAMDEVREQLRDAVSPLSNEQLITWPTTKRSTRARY